MTYMYTAILTPSDTGNKYYAKVPDIPGCVTTGSGLNDAIEQITDALSGCLAAYEDEGLEIAAPTPQCELSRGENDVCTLVRVDTLAYRARTDTKSVRKNVSLPAWMAAMADKRGINCSKVLQDALFQRLN